MFFENLKEAIVSIFSNKMRSMLTMLGIIIGISSVITITTIGSTIKRTLSATLNSLGGNSLSVYVSPIYPETDEEWETWVYKEPEEEDYIKPEMVAELLETYPQYFKGIVRSQTLCYGQIKESSTKYANVGVMGVSAGYLDYMKLEKAYGRFITAEDDEKCKNVCIIADTMASYYFKTEDPLGKTVEVESSDGNVYSLVVVGIYKYSEAVFGKPDTSVPQKDRDTTVYIPVNTVGKMTNKLQNGYQDFNLEMQPTADSKVCADVAKEFFDEKYQSNDSFQVSVYNMASDIKIIDIVINVITVAISGIAAISLIVGGVGVMNIMLVSITERTREIGVRMALGAKRKTIRLQFVIEAIVLCLIGGMIGILFGIGCGMAIGKIAQLIVTSMYAEYAALIVISVQPSLVAILLSLFFSMLTGVFFGYYPANKASKMEVIDALRYE